MRLSNALSLAVASLLVTAGVSQAAPITIVNHSFEAQVLGDGNGSTAPGTPITGWVTSAGATDVYLIDDPSATSRFNSSNPLPSPADGNQYVLPYFIGAAIQPTLAPAQVAAAGELYSLTVAIGARTDLGGNSPYLAFYLGDTSTSYWDSSIPGHLRVFTQDPVALTSGAFQDYTITYTTVAGDVGQYISPFIYSGGISSFDNVRMDGPAVVPEPATLSLAGLAGLALLRRRRD